MTFEIRPTSGVVSPAPPGQVIQLDDRLFAYVQAPGTWGLNNAGFVTSSEGALVIDSALTESRARTLAAAVNARTAGHARILLNTHHHGDHTYGNGVFPTATVIAHANCRRDSLRDGLVSTRRFPLVEYGDVGIRPAFLTLEHRLTYWADDVAVELLPVGRPAHTEGDVVCWIPDRGVMYAGDLACNGATPLALGGSVLGIIDALESLLSLRPTTVVPGHGPVGDDGVLRRNLDYFHWVMQLAEECLAAALSPLEAAGRPTPSRFEGWSDPERTVANLHRAYADLEPERVVVPEEAYADMVRWNGGEPLSCLA